MTMPRDENLRLISSDEEELTIKHGIEENSIKLSIATSAILIGIIYFKYYYLNTYDGIEESLFPIVLEYIQHTYFVLPLCAVAILVYGVRLTKYLRFRHGHREFLRKHNRL